LIILMYIIFILFFSTFIFREYTRINLIKNERKFFKLFYNAPVIMSLSGLESGRFLDVNQVFFDKLGYSKNEVIGQPVKELLKLSDAFREHCLKPA